MKALTTNGHGLDSLRQEMDRLFDRFWGGGMPTLEIDGWFPAADVLETDDALTLKFDVPGMEVKDLHVTVRDNALTIRGEKRTEYEKKDERRYRAERNFGAFSRTIPLPVPVDATNVKAQVKNGVLTVTLPKLEKAKDLEVPVLVV